MTIFYKLKLWSISRQKWDPVRSKRKCHRSDALNVLSKFHCDMQINSWYFYTHKSDDGVSGQVRQSFAVSVFALHRANVMETCPELLVAWDCIQRNAGGKKKLHLVGTHSQRLFFKGYLPLLLVKIKQRSTSNLPPHHFWPLWQRLCSPRGPDTTRQRSAKGGTSRHLTVACLTNCCQHAEMRGEGYDPAVRLKFTLPRRREDRHVTTPPNNLSQRKKGKEGRNKSGKMGGDRM